MAETFGAPKRWCLTKNETITTFESWRENQIYVLGKEENFAPFLADNVTWEKANKTNRGLKDDTGRTSDPPTGLTAAQKLINLDSMLNQVANFCPIISRNTIVKTSTSIRNVWQSIRTHYGFQTTGARFLDFDDIHFASDKSPEDLYQRLLAFLDDNLLTLNNPISQYGE